MLRTYITRAGICIMVIWTMVEIMRGYRIYRNESKFHTDKKDALIYSSCHDPRTICTRHNGHTFDCAKIRNDVKIGIIGVSIEQWLKLAWWWPERPYQLISENTWALTALAAVTITVLFVSCIGGMFLFWSMDRSDQRMWDYQERSEERMEKRLRHSLSRSGPPPRRLEYTSDVTSHNDTRRSASVPDGMVHIPSHVYKALLQDGAYVSPQPEMRRTISYGRIRSSFRSK